MEHRNLTGDSLHEPKGIETAAAGTVYESNGAGTGVWRSRLADIFNANQATLSAVIPNISETTSGFAVAPLNCQLTRVYIVLTGLIAGTNSVVTIVKNGVAQTPTITVATTGSGAGVKTTAAINPPIALTEGDVVEFRSNGGSDNAVVASVSGRLTAVA